MNGRESETEMTYMTIVLGNLDLREYQVAECGDCHSRNIVTVKGEPDKQAIAAFVRSRAGRLGLNLADYTITIDKQTGAVTATEKEHPELEIDFT
jgi:hypothetical protein